MIEEPNIGQNLKNARLNAGMTQRSVAEAAEISQTQLSDYETGNKTPGLHTLAKLSRVLEKSLDELYFGDASVSFITTAADESRALVNCIFRLWEAGVLISPSRAKEVNECLKSQTYDYDIEEQGVLLEHKQAIERLLEMLTDFRDRIDTYESPQSYLKQVLDSAAREIALESAHYQ